MHIVITGSTRGIGLGLAEAFLKQGCQVTVSGRSAQTVALVVEQLTATHGTDRVSGHPCDVTDRAALAGLWEHAESRAPVDVWINNAGINEPSGLFLDLEPDAFEAVLSTNLVGMMHATHLVARAMAKRGGGRIYNMEGLGSRGRYQPTLLVYGTTKSALSYFTRNLRTELADSPARIGTLSPGMVLTDMLRSGIEASDDPDSLKRVFNILADKVETVTPWLADQVLADKAGGADIAWLTRTGIAWRFLTAPLRRRDLFAE